MLIAHLQLPTFVVVAELLNLSAAAKQLGITQTGATQRIKALEAALESGSRPVDAIVIDRIERPTED